MFIASQKRKENIAEYLIYMWQIEDIIRANRLDIDAIKQNIVDKFQLESVQEKELLTWYENLIEMMRRENVQEKGHLQINNNVLIELDDLHQQLLTSTKFQDYNSAYYKVQPFLAELKLKQPEVLLEIEIAFNFLYGILLLRLQQKEITTETQKVLEFVTLYVSTLSKKYHQYKLGKLEIDLD